MDILKVGIVETGNDFAVNVKNDGKEDHNCSTEGVIATVFDIALQKIIQKGFGCVTTNFQQLGSYDSEKKHYTGALGATQDGDVHFVLMPAYYPMIDPSETITYSPILYEDTMVFLTGYIISEKENHGDIFYMFAQVPYGIWIAYIVSFILFTFVAYYGCRLLKDNVSAVWLSVSAFLDQDNYPETSIFMKVMSMVVMVGMFFMMAYGTNSMSTDLVSMETPTAIKSYDDIIRKKVQVMSVSILPEYEKLLNSEKGSKEYEMAKNLVDGNTHPDAMAQFVPKLFKQEAVLLMRPLIVMSIAYMTAGTGGTPKGGRYFVVQDEAAKSYTNVFVFSSKIKGSPLQTYLSTVVGKLGEHGFAHYVQERMDIMMAQSVHGSDRAGLPSHQQIITRQVEVGSPPVIDIGLEHVANVMLMVAILWLVSAFVFSIEKAYFKFVSRKVSNGRKLRKGAIVHKFKVRRDLVIKLKPNPAARRHFFTE